MNHRLIRVDCMTVRMGHNMGHNTLGHSILNLAPRLTIMTISPTMIESRLLSMSQFCITDKVYESYERKYVFRSQKNFENDARNFVSILHNSRNVNMVCSLVYYGGLFPPSPLPPPYIFFCAHA